MSQFDPRHRSRATLEGTHRADARVMLFSWVHWPRRRPRNARDERFHRRSAGVLAKYARLATSAAKGRVVSPNPTYNGRDRTNRVAWDS
jgi:hypothetical protein